MQLKVKLATEKAIRKYIQISNSILEQNKLTPIEVEVLTYLVHENYINRALTKEKRDLLVFHPSNKKRIKQVLKISDASFNNILSSLRTKKLIKDNSIAVNLPFKEGALTIDITFTLVESE